MDLKIAAFNACSEGKLHRLRQILYEKESDEIKELVQHVTNGTTPLIMACRNGHTSIVEYLVKSCSANIEQVGIVTFEGEKIEGAPPLWCAAAAGFMKIVEFLINQGSHVNITTLTNSTPLRAACFDGHYDIVKFLVENGADIEIANRHGHTCLMISCYKGHTNVVEYLIAKGADINRKSLKGNTALHDCAESGSLEIMKILLKQKARMEKDAYNMTPLLSAAVTGRTDIIDHIVSLDECQRIDKIEALELLGATYIDKKRDMLGALNLWKAAMFERYRVLEDPIPKKIATGTIHAYEHAVEAKDFKDLQTMIADPDQMRMQALLTRERILGPAHPDTSYYIRYRGAVYADMGQFNRCITLWTYALQLQQKMLDPLNAMTQSSLLSFAELFSFMMTNGNGTAHRYISYENMIHIYVLSIKELESGIEHINGNNNEDKDTYFQRLLVIIMHLLSLLCQIQDALTSEQDRELLKISYKLVKLDPRGPKNRSLLHLACDKKTSTVGRYPVCTFPSLGVANLLIEVGAAVNIIDADGNTPLHIAAGNVPCNESIIHLLLEREAHIDACNNERKTPLQLMSKDVCCTLQPLKFITLQCLASRKISACNLSYKGDVPVKLESFVQMH